MKVMYDEILRQTEKAIELRFGKRKTWIPFSQVRKEDLTWQILDLPDWLVKDKGLQEYVI